MNKSIWALLGATVLVFVFFIVGSLFFGLHELSVNVVSEIIGIIITIFVIDWLLKKSQQKKESPIKESLLSKIESRCDAVLEIFAGEWALEYGGRSLEDQLEQIRTASQDILEIVQLGRMIFSPKLQSALIKLTGLLEGSVSLPVGQAPPPVIISHDLKAVVQIKTVGEIINNTNLIAKAVATEERLKYELEWA